jgi:hypothetical protein
MLGLSVSFLYCRFARLIHRSNNKPLIAYLVLFIAIIIMVERKPSPSSSLSKSFSQSQRSSFLFGWTTDHSTRSFQSFNNRTRRQPGGGVKKEKPTTIVEPKVRTSFPCDTKKPQLVSHQFLTHSLTVHRTFLVLWENSHRPSCV